MYRSVDQTWREQPVTMSREVVDLSAARIAEHAVRHQPPYVTVIFHGGEPLLAGIEFIEYTAAAIRSAVPPPTGVDLHIQTNGVLLDERFLDMFDRHGLLVGISLDGPRTANDRHRVFANGEGSYESIARALALLNEDRYRHLYSGILCTIDVSNDPLEVFRGLLDFQPPTMDFLLPHGNWTSPPPHLDPTRPDTTSPNPTSPKPTSSDTPYAQWLIAIFDEWYGTVPQRTSIRLFESLIDLVLGGPTRSEAVGLGPDGLAVIECDGSIEQTDVLKTTVEGGAATGLHIASASLDEVNALPVFRARHAGFDGLCATCRACPIARICGGGLYAHRFRADNGFDNPSVYCSDLTALIGHIGSRVRADLTRLGLSASEL